MRIKRHVECGRIRHFTRLQKHSDLLKNKDKEKESLVRLLMGLIAKESDPGCIIDVVLCLQSSAKEYGDMKRRILI